MNQIENLKEYAIANHIPVIKDDGLEFILKTAKENNIRTVLEVGTAIARTAIALASLSKDIQVVTIERDSLMIEQAKKNIKDAGLEKQITLIEEDALTCSIPEKQYDLIFIDAAKAQYERFFSKFTPFLSANGIIISDNMSFHGLVEHPERTKNRNTRALVKKIKRYQEFLKGLDSFQTEFLDIGDGLAITRRM